jgi:hypothetical protein
LCWIRGELWCFAWCVSAAKNTPTFSTIFSDFPIWEFDLKKGRHTPRAKAPFILPERGQG